MSRFAVATVMVLGLNTLVFSAPGAKALSPEAITTGEQFTSKLQNIATTITREYVKKIAEKDLYAAAITALYSTARQPTPERLLEDLRASNDEATTRNLLVQARAKLHGFAQLEDNRDLFVAINSFTTILDPASVLIPSAALNGTYTSQQFGFEFEGEANVTVGSRGRRPANVDDQLPFPTDAMPSLPFRVLFVKPGSPAQKAGLRPGDQITHIDDIRADAREGAKAFAALHKSGSDPQRHTLMVERVGQAKVIRITVNHEEEFVQESLFGVKRKANNEWDYWLDHKAGIAYIRVGALEHDSGDLLAEILHDLRDVKGLLLDLRWCPGGYIDSATQIASTFLEKGVIAKMKYRNTARGENRELHADGGLVRHKAGDYPILILVNGETIGGGELIAAALKDNGRAVLAGTRTFGKATIQWPETLRELPGYSFKITGGTYTRPNGKNLQRFPNSKPTDDWGLLPDEGYTIPTSVDLAKKLKEMHMLYALRPGSSREALELDDPDTDPQRVRATKLLRELLTKQQK
jgi:carboxyl-terminal processing protease